MTLTPEIKITKTFNTDKDYLWRTITEKELMKQWYFDLAEFIPEVGFKFNFWGGHVNGIQYNHLCEITEVVREEKLSYTWKYEGYEGGTLLTFDLSENGGITTLVFTHAGLNSFPNNNPDFAIANFQAGWDHFINNALPAFIEK